VPNLTFPDGQAIGTLDWLGSGAAPVLACGVVTVPDGAEISLDVRVIESVRKTDAQQITGGVQPADLSFLRQLPADSITDLHLRAPILPGSFAAVKHLAPGLRKLYLARADLTDDALKGEGENGDEDQASARHEHRGCGTCVARNGQQLLGRRSGGPNASP
jgi:hypothetical protein